MADEQHEGASPSRSMASQGKFFTYWQLTDEQLLSAARTDNEEMLLVVFGCPEKFDINFTDGCVH